MKWTEKEEEFLKQHYPYGSKKFLINLTGRSWQAIQLKASYLRIKRFVKYNPSEETRKKLSQKLCSYWKGRHMPEETRRKISQSKKGYTPSKETIEKLKKSHLGNKQSEETIRKISLKNRGRAPWIKGKHHSEETKQKLRLVNKGQIPWNKGRKQSIETRRKMSLSSMGKRLSGETRKKISEIMKRDRIDLSKYKDEIIAYYQNGHNSDYIGRLYRVCRETILRRLKNWGVNIKKNRFSYTRIVTKDGHVVNSYAEKIIDNKLFSLGIKHIRDKKILDTRMKCDWYIPKLRLYIEYWGMMGIEFYDKKKEKKLELYKVNGLDLLSIFPEDLRKLGDVMNQISTLKNKENKKLVDFICTSSHLHQDTPVQRSSSHELSTLPT